MWQRKTLFYYLWVVRALLGVIACLVSVGPMWVELRLEQRTGVLGAADTWASSALVACIAGSIVAEVSDRFLLTLVWQG
jgi:hypothetical protein